MTSVTDRPDGALTNYFDHDVPTGAYTGDGTQLTFCDERLGGRLDGHQGEPHLHLQVWRFNQTNNSRPTVIDPYGWEGAGPDPWAESPAGAGSVWLWRPGDAPRLRPR